MAQGSTSPSADFAISGMAGVDFARVHTSSLSNPAPHKTGTTVPITGNRIAIYCVVASALARVSNTVSTSVTVTVSGGVYKVQGVGVSYQCPVQLNQALSAGEYVWVIKDGSYV